MLSLFPTGVPTLGLKLSPGNQVFLSEVLKCPTFQSYVVIHLRRKATTTIKKTYERLVNV